MKNDVSKYPIRIEYSGWKAFPPKFNNKLIIDFETAEDDIQILLDLVSINKNNEYEQLSDSQKTDMGYRDGWHTDYKIVMKNDIAKTGVLLNYYKESPLENVLNYLRVHYPYIEMLRSL